MIDAKTLLPCPFCGGPVNCGWYAVEFCIQCDNCEFTFSGESEQSLIAKWNAQGAPARVVELEAEVERLRGAQWQPIETAPKDGTKVDLWCVSHLRYENPRRVVNVEWGLVRDFIGNERMDWRHGYGEDMKPTHWMPVPATPEQEGK